MTRVVCGRSNPNPNCIAKKKKAVEQRERAMVCKDVWNGLNFLGFRIVLLQWMIFFSLVFLCVHVCVVFCALCIFDISLQLLEIHNLTLIPRLFKHIYMQVVQMPTWMQTLFFFASHLARNGANSTHLNSMSDQKTVYKTRLGNSLTTETSKYARILWMAEANQKKQKVPSSNPRRLDWVMISVE